MIREELYHNGNSGCIFTHFKKITILLVILSNKASKELVTQISSLDKFKSWLLFWERDMKERISAHQT